jgi:hypothetical protein
MTAYIHQFVNPKQYSLPTLIININNLFFSEPHWFENFATIERIT